LVHVRNKKKLSKRKLILGSASPRRRELLAPHFQLVVRPANIDESVRVGEKPLQYVRRIAREKFKALSLKFKGESLLTADTVVILGRDVLGKPTSRQDAKQMLGRLSGREHRVTTAVCLRWGASKEKLFTYSTRVLFRKISEQEIEAYLKSGEWKGKAGSYAIQGQAQSFVASIHGSLTNVIGLPLERVI
jgi:septum formation protein